MSSEPNTEEILAALRKSGYLMEQEVATELENLGFNVSRLTQIRLLDGAGGCH